MSLLNYPVFLLFLMFGCLKCSNSLNAKLFQKGKSSEKTVSNTNHRTVKKTLKTKTNDFPVVFNKKVKSWVQFFDRRGQRTIQQWFRRGQVLQPIIQSVLEREGVPKELYFAALVESNLIPTARSRAKAVGPWQFIAGTARVYGLTVNDWIDERRDPVKSTVAASAYLKDLYSQFNDWYLALAAYNSGPAKIRQAIRKSKSKDFWLISAKRAISKETRNHIPKILAAIVIDRRSNKENTERFFDISKIYPTTSVEIRRPIRISELSSLLNVSRKQIKRWNPELLREITPPLRAIGKKSYELRLAPKYLQPFYKIEKHLTKLRVRDIKLHKIKIGETVFGIARRYRVSQRKILQLNPGLRPKFLKLGSKIAVPVTQVVQGIR